MSSIFLIQGNTGMWDSYRTWNVIAYADEQKAIERVAKLNDLTKVVGFDKVFGGGYGRVDTWHPTFDFRLEHMKNHIDGDKNCDVDTNGVEYGYVTVELGD